MIENATHLRPEQLAGIEALMSTRSVEAAAKKVKVAPSTLYRWLREDDFKTAYRQVKSEVVGHALTRLQNATTKAVDALIAIVGDTKASAQTRVTAAKTILDFSTKAVETEEILARLEALEQATQQRMAA